MNALTGRLVAVIAAIIAVPGCTSGAGADKSGGRGNPVVLTFANSSANLDLQPNVAYFVDRVAEVSGGQLRVEVTHAWGDYAADYEQQVVRDVADGKVDLAWAGTRIFDTLGVTSFQALTAPMLIDNYALQDAVMRSDLPGQMLPGLEPLGVTGLALLADVLRKPLAVTSPLLAPADWRGITFGTTKSGVQEAAIRALGATPLEVVGRHREEALDAGELDAFEQSLLAYQIIGLVRRAPHVTANVNLWPQTVTLIADSDRLTALTKDQREWLATAAADAVARSRQLANRDATLAAEVCANGAQFANASPTDLDALRGAFAPVYAELARDAQTKTFIDRIEALKATTPPEAPLAIPADCTPTAAPASSAGATSTLDGVYRWTLTVDDARTHGTANDQQHLDDWYPTTFTVTLRDGTWEARQTVEPGVGTGTFEVTGNRIAFNWPEMHSALNFTYTVGANGNLTLKPISPMDPGDQFVWSTHAWTKIG